MVLFSTLIVLAIGGLVGSKGDHGFSSLSLLAIIVMIIVRIGYTKIFLRIHDGENPRLVDLFKEYKTFWRYLGVSILFPLAVLGGLILIIIPGLIWAVRFSFSPIAVIDTKIGPIAAMKESYAITKGKFWKLLFFWIVIGLVNLLGLICFGIGLLITAPVTTLAAIYAYRTMSKERAGLAASPQVI